MLRLFKVGVCALILGIPFAACAQERVLSYDSQIEVFKDASVIVTETISVISEGDQIKRGIYRDFPIAYQDNKGQRYFVTFDIQSVTRNGAEEPYHTERAGNGVRVYIGDADVFIPDGEHTYKITYKTERQIGFFPDHDELYWNVTGNGWVFAIESASATVKLPGTVQKEDITATLYTGAQGSVDKNATWNINDDSTVSFKTNQVLGAYEGLTIVVGWPKGAVMAPTASQNFWATVRANLDFIIGVLGVVVVFGFYFFAWSRYGRDPKKGTIIPLYESPQGFSPAFLRYVTKMGSDNKAFAAAIINMGVKRALTVTEVKEGLFKKTSYVLNKAEVKDNKAGSSKGKLSQEEALLNDKFFSGGMTFELKKSESTTIYKIVNEFSSSLKSQAGKRYFHRNIPAIVIGIILTAATTAGAIIAAANVRFSVGSPLEILFWPAMIITLVIVNVVFGVLMKRYTLEGRKLADEIEGFKQFLKVTEKDRLAFHNPPQQTPELFEKMLPYALALGVEHEWAQQFAQVFARLKDQGVQYAPAWYYGSTLTNFTPTAFASSVGNTFSGVVASSATPPGSSSGAGGSSGGGGGGGGGGGW